MAASKVLVVDDEEPLARMVAEYLRRDAFDVAVVGDGMQAVRVARDLSPDVVVLDLGLPGLDGVEVCRQLADVHRLLRSGAHRAPTRSTG